MRSGRRPGHDQRPPPYERRHPRGPGMRIKHRHRGCPGERLLGSTYCNGRATPSTNTLEREIIFGGEERLSEQLRATLRIVDADLYAVITGCMTDIIGDDTSSVVRQFRSEGHPVVVAETGGFKGNSAKGYELIWKPSLSSTWKRAFPSTHSASTCSG